MSDTTDQTLSPSQEKFVMNMLANLSSSYPAKDVAALEKQMDKVQKCLGFLTPSGKKGWKVVWGPALVSSKETPPYTFNPKHVTDNAMYVAQSQDDTTQYFVGIAGTNAISNNGWFAQDFVVKETVNWPPSFLGLPAQSAGYISKGASVGLQNHWLKMTDKKHGTLVNYFAKEVANDSNVTVSGHSLGGCLSPVIATALADAMAAQVPAKKLNITACPTAGPTPGDVDFANHLTSKISYDAMFNQHDMVPLAWNFDAEMVKGLLDSFATFKVAGVDIDSSQQIITSFLKWAKDLGATHPYVREPQVSMHEYNVNTWPNGNASDATSGMVDLFVKYVLKSSKVKANLLKLNKDQALTDAILANFARFLIEVGSQHVSAYWHHMQIPTTLRAKIKAEFYAVGGDEIMKLWLLQEAKELFATLTGLAAEAIDASYDSETLIPEAEAKEVEPSTQELDTLFGDGGITLPWFNRYF